MSRRLYLDDGPGEARGVVVLGERPERILIRRLSTDPARLVGARLAARVRKIERPLAMAFLDVGTLPDAVTPLVGPASALSEGLRVEVEVMSPPRGAKGAVVGIIGPCNGEPRLLCEAPALVDQLRAFAPTLEIIGGPQARAAADAAEEDVLQVTFKLHSGGSIAVEPTRALIAVDVDLGAASGPARQAATRANREAILACARLTRLKGLGGAVVIDLAGKGHDGEALKGVATEAFAPDGPGVVLGAITRFGLWPIILPHRAAPVAEILCSDESKLTDETLGLRLLRQIERAAGAGERIDVRAEPSVSKAALSLAPYLSQRIGGRFRILEDPTVPRDRPQLGPWEGST